MDEQFLGKIDGLFICLTAAILCHSLRCWRTGNFMENVAFTGACSKGKTSNANLWFTEVYGSLGAPGPRHPDTLETLKYLKG